MFRRDPWLRDEEVMRVEFPGADAEARRLVTREGWHPDEIAVALGKAVHERLLAEYPDLVANGRRRNPGAS